MNAAFSLARFAALHATPSALAIAGTATLLFALCFRPLSDPDIWFYLAQGREIVSSGKVPATEFYIFPALGEPAVYSAIGFSVFYFLTYQAGGYAGMAAVNSLLAAAGIALVLLAARQGSERQGDGAAAYILAGLVAYFLMEFRFVYRPENLLFVFVGAELVLLEAWLAGRRHLLLLAVPPMVAILSWFHTSAVLLVAVFGCYVTQFVVDALRQGSTNRRREWTLVGGTVFLLLLIPSLNPNGWEQFLVILRSLVSPDSGLVEYLPALGTEYRWHFLGAAALAAAALLLAPRRRVVDYLLVGVFGAVAYVFVRNIGLFALIAALPLTRALLHLKLPSRLRRLPLAASAVLILIAVTWTAITERWGFGIDRGAVLHGAVEEIRRSGLSNENLMNFFHHGGYLAWELGPASKVAIDGHFVRPTYASDYHDRVLRADPDWESLLASHNVRLILSPVTLPYSGAFVPLITQLSSRNDWQLVSVEPAGVMLARADVADRFARLPKLEIWRQAARELDELLRTYPENATARHNRVQAMRRAEALAQ